MAKCSQQDNYTATPIRLPELCTRFTDKQTVQGHKVVTLQLAQGIYMCVQQKDDSQ